MKILMSIKPKYVAKIMSGEKCFEFRKKLWNLRQNDKDINQIVIYSSAPVQRIVGEVEAQRMERIHIYDEYDLYASWEVFEEGAGITQREFLDYYANSNVVCVLYLGNFRPYDRPYTLQEKYPHLKRPPQSFCYIED